MNAVLRINNLGVTFVGGDAPVHAVVAASLTVDKGQRVGVIGESGSGKSVMARAAMRLDNPRTTRFAPDSVVEIEGRDILSLSETEMHRLRGDTVSMVFQNPMHSLNPSFTIGSQLSSVYLTHRTASRSEARRAVVDALAAVDLPGPEELMHRYPHELSGGQRQRVMIAMAVLCGPRLVIADEPTSALDVTAQDTVLEIMRRLSVDNQIAVLMITHDMGVVARFCEVVNVMYGGRIVETADVRTLFSAPAHPYTAALLAATPDPLFPEQGFTAIPGTQESRSGVSPTACAFADRCPYAQEVCETAPPFEKLTETQTVACHFAGTLPLKGKTGPA